MPYTILWIFFVYAFLGWCSEVSYAALVTGKFVNRGFLNGPWCPVYGFGAIAVLACLDPLKDNLPLLFLGSALLTSALEWLTGFVLEKLFHLSGYICLRFSILWGFACLFVVKLLHPTVLLLIRLLPQFIGLPLLVLLCAVMAVDLAATVASIVRLNRRLALIDELGGKIKVASNVLGEDLSVRVLDAAEKGAGWKVELEELSERLAQRRAQRAGELEELQDRLDSARDQARRQMLEWQDSVQEVLNREDSGQRRLMRAFPKLRSTRHRRALERLRRRHNQE